MLDKAANQVSSVTEAADAKVKVSVWAEYMPEIKIAGDSFCFAYQITIHNIGKTPFQLLARRWQITDGNGTTREISGEGVVGKQPRLPPAHAFTYASYVDLPTLAGSMSGAYLMRQDDERRFEAVIPCFSLFVPGAIH